MADSRPSPELVVADNLRRIFKHRGLASPDAAKLLGVKPFQIDRFLAAEHAMTLRTLGRLADKLGFEAYQLLVPGLDAGNPQILRVLSASEQELYRALDRVRRDVAG